MRELLKKEQRERQRLTEEVGRMRTTNENLNRKMDQLKSENDLLRTTSLHTGINLASRLNNDRYLSTVVS